jgi:formylglycine-generating enzyme
MPSKSFIPPEAPTIPLAEWSGGETASQANRPSIELGTVLAGRYKLIAVIGEGGSGRVYEAIDLNQPEGEGGQGIVALKVLTHSFDETAGRFAALHAHFNRWRHLVHPNIVRLFDCQRDGPIVFITMEYVAGESVYSKLHRGMSSPEGPPAPLDREEARRIIASVCRALDYTHRQGLVHGDLKPGNVIVNGTLEVKVIDFCVTRWLSRPNRAAGVHSTAATPQYASPQVMSGDKLQPADDVFSLACFAYEIMTGVHPFEGVAGARPPPRPPGLTPGEHAALLRGLRPDRADRTATVAEFVAEFGAAPRRSLATLWPLWLGAAAIGLFVWLHYRQAAPIAPAARPPQAAARLPAETPRVAPPANARPGALIQDCPGCPSMTVLPPGRFAQGAADDERDVSPFERPRHWVNIGYPFAMSTTDITVDDFRPFAAATGRDMQGCDTYDGDWRHRPAASWEKPGFNQSGRHPVTCISWNDAVAYAEWLSGKSGHRYRLPSASEWEYAARAGAEAVQPWQSDAHLACANADVADRSAEQRFPGWAVFPCDDGYVFTAPAGSFKANAFGLQDMLGNVLVWTQDCWWPDYEGAPSDGSARVDLPRGDLQCREHELRGGSWFSSPPAVKATSRNRFASGYRTSSVGFRLVRELN